MTGPFVSLEAAKLLAQLGYNEECSHAYSDGGVLISKLSTEENDVMLLSPAPLWQEAVNWIGREYGLFVGAITSVDDSLSTYFCKVVNRNNNVTMGVSARGSILFDVIGEVVISMLRQANVISQRREVLGDKVFPNGFRSWMETYFEVVSHIAEAGNNGRNIVTDISENQGTAGLYDLAENTTDLFEEAYLGSYWDEKDFFDEVEKFCNKQFKKH